MIQLPVPPVYQVFGKSKREWASVPAFKKPMIKKKLGLV
jgi:hypothetical protein